MSTLTQFVGNSYQMRGQLSPLSATAAVAQRCGPGTAGRPVMLDPCTGQAVCCSPVDNRSATLLHPPTAASHHGLSAVMYAAAEKDYMHYAADSPMFYPQAMADGRAMCIPYDLSPAQYPYYGESCGYPMDLTGARRKNATRETTSTLKAWLYEHRKNPYPTKGEKIMLAIITKMTLTQVSTWFANARRRLKKENKMTWSPRNRCDDDRKEDYESEDGEDQDRDDDMDGLGTDLDSNHNGKLSDIDDTQDKVPAGWNVGDLDRTRPCDSSQAPFSEPRVPVGIIGTNSGRDSVSVTVDDEEDSVIRSRGHCSPLSSYHRRSPSPAPLAPSIIRPTCRPTSRSPPCEKVLPRQTEKPKFWSLAETALSKSPERRPQRPSHTLNLTALQSRYKPYNSPVETPELAMKRLMTVQAPRYEASFVNEIQAGQPTISLPPFISRGLTTVFPSGGVPSGFHGPASSSPRLHHEKAATVNTT